MIWISAPQTFPFEDATRANKQPVIHGIIITHFMSANYKMIPLLSTNANSNKGTDHCCALQRVCAADGRDCNDSRTFGFHDNNSE